MHCSPRLSFGLRGGGCFVQSQWFFLIPLCMCLGLDGVFLFVFKIFFLTHELKSEKF